jgi:CheY-like chemotaxis protein/HPt (histidine-containing phosphotransfer) domain-containing protein
VLIVDDNATNRHILALQTSSWKMDPQPTESPLEALQWVEQGKAFDVAILDMQMPDMDGVTLAREIRRTEHGEFPLVMLTSLGHRDVDGKEEFAAFLSKPVKASQLYNALVGIFGGTAGIAEREKVEGPQFDPELATRIPLRILLAEDNAINQKIALLLLKKMGYTADVASNGTEAVEAVRRQHYDVVLMDVQMPEMDGFEATAVIRDQLPADWQPRIIAMTANAMEGDRELCLAARMDDYVAKPIRAGELQSALERCVSAGSGLPLETVAETDEAQLDERVWKQLREAEKADPGIVEDLIRIFRTETPPILLKVKEAVAAGDADKLKLAAHNLKGSSSNFGMMRLAAVSAELEQKARAGSIDGAGDLSVLAEREFEIACRLLDAEMGKG